MNAVPGRSGHVTNEFKKTGRSPVTVQDILESIQATFAASDTEILDGPVLHGPLADGTLQWGTIRRWMRLKLMGLSEENCPYNNLRELVKDRLHTVTPEEVADSIRATRRAIGENPRREDGYVQFGALADRRLPWDKVADFIVHKTNGLNAENCPYENLKEMAQVVAVYITPDEILESIDATFTATGKTPNAASGKIEHGPLAHLKLSWWEVHNFIRDKTHGLTAENCPYDGLGDFSKNEYLKISTEEIVESVTETVIETNSFVFDGVIEYGPLANGKRTWDMVRDYMWRKIRGLTEENCPYKTLPALMRDRGIYELDLAHIRINPYTGRPTSRASQKAWEVGFGYFSPKI